MLDDTYEGLRNIPREDIKTQTWKTLAFVQRTYANTCLKNDIFLYKYKNTNNVVVILEETIERTNT